MFMFDLGGDSYYSFLNLLPTATPEEIRAARDKKFAELENLKRAAKDPEERRKLEERQKEVGQKGDTLARPDSRAKYDEANAHLRFFIVRPAAAPLYVDKTDRLFAIDRAVRRFLAGRNFAAPPLCDLDRTDFSADEQRIELLDRLLR